MKILKDVTPAERKTTLELSDREIGLLKRALSVDNPSDVTLLSANYALRNEFDDLTSQLGIVDLDGL